MADQVFGIDLGTTYSAIAYVNGFGQAEVVLNRDNEPTTPSVVYFENETNFVVGKEAKNEVLLHPDTTVALIKRRMGTDFTLDFFGKQFRPETISALILKDLVDYARDATGVDTNKVAITVPAYFGLAEREATRQAGAIAGLDVVGICTEPVAAALSVGITGEQARTLFVYDLGGGTFDCTVMQMSADAVDTIVIDGNRVLGGADWDTRLFDLVKDKFVAQAGLEEDPTADEDFSQKLMTQVEDLKRALSRKDKASVTLSYGDALEKVEVTRAEFEAATRSLVEETLTIVRRTLAAAQEKRPGLVIDDVLLVGGSSHMPMIEASLTDELGLTLHKTDMELAVAKGAAIYAGGVGTLPEPVPGGGSVAPVGGSDQTEKRLVIDGKSVVIHNVLSRSVGVLYVREDASAPGGWQRYVGFEAHQNESLPLDATFEAFAAQDDTTQVAIELFEQNSAVEEESPASNRTLTTTGVTTLTNLPHLPKGSLIQFDLHVDPEGQSSLSAFEPVTGQRIQMGASLSVMQAEDVAKATEIVSGMTRRED